MKNIIQNLLIVLFIFSAGHVFSQAPAKKIVTSEFKVEGVCDMCKKRIENAAFIKGVRLAEWNKATQTLKVIYSSKKTDQSSIEQAIADVGHKAGNTEANKEAYEKLPACCQYERSDIDIH